MLKENDSFINLNSPLYENFFIDDIFSIHPTSDNFGDLDYPPCIFTPDYCRETKINKLNLFNTIIDNKVIRGDVIKEKLPLVSILIPTYNQTEYLERALMSALNQTYTNIEIIICDDSTSDEVEKMVNRYMVNYKNIKYFNNGGPLGQIGILNGEKCFDLSNGEYINYLFHDDTFYPNKIEIMVKYFEDNKDVTLVTSYRNRINENDELVYIPEKIYIQNYKDKWRKLRGVYDIYYGKYNRRTYYCNV